MGFYYSENKLAYQGEFKDDKYNGIGVSINDDFIYEGEHENEVCKGRGIKVYKNEENETYEGDWDAFELTGYGKKYENNKLIYEGYFLEGFFHGKGEKYYENGNIYKGEFKFGVEDGMGKLIKNGIEEPEYIWIKGTKKNEYFKNHLWNEMANQLMIRISRNKIAKEFNSLIDIRKNPLNNKIIETPMDFGIIKVNFS